MKILVSTSKGDNFKIDNVDWIKGDDTYILIDSEGEKTFDRVPRDRDIEMVNIEVEDVGF